MKGLIQRVSRASVQVDGKVVGQISKGLLLFLGVEKGDDRHKADKLLEKVLSYRVFPDVDGRMNVGLKDIEGELLIISQFTLVADTQKGLRPGFSSAATPDVGEALYDYFIGKSVDSGLKIASGVFGADMAVSLVNDGPVTFMLSV
jgi:D-aminoacyl-tRNA deacylase